MTQRDPGRLIQIGMGFWPAKTLLSAVELDLFTVLGDKALTARQLQNALELHPRGIADFLDTLVALDVLARDGEGETAQYRNTEDAAYFLDRNSSAYIGGFLDMANVRLYRFWADLTEALKTGKPQNEMKHGGEGMFEELYRNPQRLEQFVNAMAGISLAFPAVLGHAHDARGVPLRDQGAAVRQPRQPDGGAVRQLVGRATASSRTR